MKYLHSDFLLPNKTAQRLYHEVAAEQPIIDYHCHLPPEEVAGDVGFKSITDIWLGGDHYKWRAMRAAGESEELVTGDAEPKDKFLAWARTVPQTLRNPLHHWTHLELKRCFDCDLVLGPDTAEEIWELTNAKLAESDFTTQKILKQFDVRVVGTTDDPADSLEHHAAFAKSGHPTKMCPTYRPDKAMITTDLDAWNAWTDKLGDVSEKKLDSAADLIDALKQRHDFFHEHGCRLTDHGLESCPCLPCSDSEAAAIFKKLRNGDAPSADESEQWMTYILQQVGRWNAEKGWTMQFHIGPIRNNNSRLSKKLGPDAGFDSMLDEPIARKTIALLDSLASEDALPKCIFYHVNPTMLYPFATLMGSFQDGKTAGKMQLGSGWWHVDTLDGMRTQIETLSSVGLLSQFVGMLTDSRSFLSYPRHEYFRRLLCNIIGTDVEAGLIPDDKSLLDNLVSGICYENADRYFGFPK
ncbi:glucuronate isomerase [Coraliomargarita sinensis]|uniref:Uronate isomerase n=1 Tax=Coraliomargarita sinensis TaxID=2174842 RepID=A0A317ZEY0_9BACT|nr:glucuronate isomerase [Coraliomargarita sinensis]PXA02907.1 glucuronate isomerase [Coraliomargarita sinensis]